MHASAGNDPARGPRIPSLDRDMLTRHAPAAEGRARKSQQTCRRIAVKAGRQRQVYQPRRIILPTVQHYSRAARPSRARGAVSNWLLLAVVIAIGVWWFGMREAPSIKRDAGPIESRSVIARGDLAEDEKNNIAVFKTASVSTVHITTMQAQRGFFSLDATQVPKG